MIYIYHHAGPFACSKYKFIVILSLADRLTARIILVEAIIMLDPDD